MKKMRTLRARFLVGIGVAVLLVLLWLATSFFAVFQLSRAMETGTIQRISSSSRYLHYSSSTLSKLTLHQSSNIESITALLHLASQADLVVSELEKTQELLVTETIDLTNLLTRIASLEQDVHTLAIHLPNCTVCSKAVPQLKQIEMNQLLESAKLITQIAEYHATGTHRYLVLFQNSDELRATGGFTGSYTVVTISDGVLEPIRIMDIYDADGQFTGFIPAPHGVDEYLSSSRGLRLPDANWDPHFPTSAKQMLQFFALGETKDIEGVIAITDNYFEDLLTLVGPVWLPDYQLEVTSDNLTEVLRSDRNDFFAGSIQKKHLLEQFQNQLLITMDTATLNPKEILAVTATHMAQKNILGYSSNPDMEALFATLGIDGRLQTDSTKDILAFVESNVGINKANKGVSRALSLRTEGMQLIAEYYLENSNTSPSATNLDTLLTTTKEKINTASASADHLAYVNYQRVLYPQEWQIESISVPYQENVVVNTETRPISATSTVKESGFLVVVPEQSSVVLTLTFTLPKPALVSNLELYKQPGTEPVPVWISTDRQQPFSGNPTLILEKNRATITP